MEIYVAEIYWGVVSGMRVVLENSKRVGEAGWSRGRRGSEKQLYRGPQLVLQGTLELRWPFRVVSNLDKRTEPL